jgi:hypothetical protein
MYLARHKTAGGSKEISGLGHGWCGVDGQTDKVCAGNNSLKVATRMTRDLHRTTIRHAIHRTQTSSQHPHPGQEIVCLSRVITGEVSPGSDVEEYGCKRKPGRLRYRLLTYALSTPVVHACTSAIPIFDRRARTRP